MNFLMSRCIWVKFGANVDIQNFLGYCQRRENWRELCVWRTYLQNMILVNAEAEQYHCFLCEDICWHTQKLRKNKVHPQHCFVPIFFISHFIGNFNLREFSPDQKVPSIEVRLYSHSVRVAVTVGNLVTVGDIGFCETSKI